MIAIVVTALLLAAEVARLTLATSYAATRPDLAERLAPRLPQVLASAAMAEVGQAAAAGQNPPQQTTQRLRMLTRSAPLAAEPLLVAAAVAQKAGDLDRAEQLLLQARARDPRSAAARYLLADVWLQQDRVADGLGEMAVLSRLLPGSSQLVPALAQYAQTPGGGERLKRVLEVNPNLKQPLLNSLSSDPANLQLVLELDRAVPTRPSSTPPPWQVRLLAGLIEQGDYDRAYALWQRFAGHSGPRPLLFNSDFRQLPAPPPFNWSFASAGAGFAEPANGSARVLFYGRQDATLASQLLLLEPGRYRFSSGVSGTAAPASLAWVLSCVPGRTTPMQLEVRSAPTQATFEVSSQGCRAQSLELRGRGQDVPQESDLHVGPVTMERLGR